MSRRKRKYGSMCALPMLLCLITAFYMGVWYERHYGAQEPTIDIARATVAIHILPEPPVQWQTFIATAYCPCPLCCGSNADGITACGDKAREGVTVAADWEILPEGTIIEIEGIGYRLVQDTGSLIKGHRIDIYFDSHEEALEFGVQEVKVRVVKEGE